jgi:outer membrane biosynthesis protein TonB
MIKFFKNIKNKLYYTYIDKIINSPENIEVANRLEDNEKIQIIEIQNEHIPLTLINDMASSDPQPEKKKPGRPKATVEKKPTPTKKAPATKKPAASSKPKPKSE